LAVIEPDLKVSAIDNCATLQAIIALAQDRLLNTILNNLLDDWGMLSDCCGIAQLLSLPWLQSTLGEAKRHDQFQI
jgi:hypothetical protein